jgi:hypothetical protein
MIDVLGIQNTGKVIILIGTGRSHLKQEGREEYNE